MRASIVGLLLALLVACGGIVRPTETPALVALLDSADPSERAWAISELTKRRAPEAIPGLIRRLRDEDGGIRLYAVQGLRVMSGEKFGYRPSASAAERELAVARWEAWSNGDRVEGTGSDQP